MGILDEAIREHLDLKRRQGAAEDELSRLEDEAFGPPSRPGDPEFPEAGADAATGEEAQILPQAEVAEAPSEEAPVVPEAEAPSAPPAEPEANEPEAAEPEVPAEGDAGSGFYNAEAEEEEDLDIDLDLDIEDEIERVGGLEVDEKPEAAASEEAPPISQLDTVEHHFEDAIDEAEVVEEESPGPPTEEEAQAPPTPPDEADDEGEDEGGEDVLEETPEFLQDTPEDDELWFEQGEPKDFDF
jgi:hypothetical protein